MATSFAAGVATKAPSLRCYCTLPAHVRFGAPSGLKSDIAPCPVRADIVAKVFSGWRTKILRAAEAFYARRREGPYRFIRNRSRTSVVALKRETEAEKSEDQHSRDFWGCSIFDFCNNIGQKGKSQHLDDGHDYVGLNFCSNLATTMSVRDR